MTQTRIILPSKTFREDNIKALYVGINYQDEADKQQWLPMVKISWNKGYYYYSFTKGFAAHYDELKGNVLNPQRGYTQTWKDQEVPWWLNQRIPHRADSMEIYDIFGLGNHKGDFIALFARTGGRRNGDYYDLFAELAPQDNRYEYYFPIFGLPGLVKAGKKAVAALADNIKRGQELELVLTPERCEIYCLGIYIGHTPPYLHYLLSHNPQCQYRAWTEIVNSDEYRYAYKIVGKIEVYSTSSIYSFESLQPINLMPIHNESNISSL